MNLQFRIKNFIFWLFILHFSFFIFHSKAFADTISLSVDPPILQINATPPANITSPLTIENRGDTPLDLNIELKSFVPSDQENGQISYIDQKSANLPDPLFFQRVKLLDQNGQPVTEFKLDPKQKKPLILSIVIPKDSPQSDYYFSIIFLSNPQSENINSSQNVTGIASNVILSVGQGKTSGQIEEFSAPVFVEKGPVPFTVRIKNTGNHFIRPKGEILIKNLFGQTIGRVDLQEVNILSQSVRSIPSTTYADSNNNLPSILAAYWPEKFLLGPYKATLSISLSDTGPLFRRSIIFLAFPAQATVITLLVIIILVYITIKVRSKI